MKKIPCLVLLLAFCSSYAFAQHAASAEAPVESPSLADLRWSLNMVLSQQLPNSVPDSLNGKVFLKGFSFSYTETPDGYLLEVPELRHKLEDGTTNGGSKYYLPFKDIDLPNIKIVTTPDEKYTALIIPALPGKTFLHHPYGYEPDRQVEALTIGWYERVQDRTLARALVHL